MIETSSIKSLRNGEIIAFFDNLISIVEKADMDALKLSGFWNDLESQIDTVKELYKEERGSKITQSLVNLDKARDLLLIALRNILEQHAIAHPQEQNRPKAQQLLDTVNRYGSDLYRKSYQEQTAGMTSIAEIIDASEEMTQSLKDLHLTEYYTAMKSANEDFDSAYLERNSEYAQSPKEKLREERTQAESLFFTLSKKINAYLELAEDAQPYAHLTNEIAALVGTYDQVASRRKIGVSTGEEVDDGPLDADEVEAVAE